jgi:Ca-activated chloride channel family protein
MLRRVTLSLGFALSTLALCVGAQDGNVVDTIKIETRLVSVPVIVSDRSGRYVPNLTAAAFTILQDGAPQAIEFFAAVEEPLTIALLIDTSQSTHAALDDIKDSARSFIKLLSPRDRAMIVSFDYDVHILSQLTSDHEVLKRAIKNAEIPDRLIGTMLRDAAFQTVNRSFADIKGRKAVIILTDGKDVGSRITGRDLLYSLQETDTLIYTIMFKTFERVQIRFPGIYGRMPPQMRQENARRNERFERLNAQAQSFLQELSTVSAGRFYLSKDGKLKTTFASIVEELRFQYRLGFYPPEETGDKTLHELKVKVARPETVVRARNSYRVR